ncbi:MAG: hypothetical protein AAGI63_17600, partial [Planctomycetota bacterium]
FGDNQGGHAYQQGQGLSFTQTLFLGVDLFTGLNFAGRKKLLRTIARRSALAMVAPINFFLRHDGLQN